MITITAKGKGVEQQGNLKSEDLILTENGAEQKTYLLKATPGEENQSVVVLLLDSSHFFAHSGFPSHNPVANSAAEAIKAAAVKELVKLPPDLPLAIYASDLNLNVYREFKYDGQALSWSPALMTKDLIKEAASVFRKTGKDFQAGTFVTYTDPDTAVVNHIKQQQHKHMTLHTESALVFGLAQLESISDHLAALPGKKAVVWFCDQDSMTSSPPEGKRFYPWLFALASLQRSNTAVYPVNCASSGPQAYKPASARLSELSVYSHPYQQVFDHIDSRKLASLSGGRYYDSYTDLDKAILDAFNDMAHSYQLSWPASSNQEAGPLCRITLSSKRSQVNLLYPHVYINAIPPQTFLERLNSAELGLITPLSAHAIRMDTRSYSDPSGQPFLSMSVDPKSVALDERGQRLHGLLDVIIAYYDGLGTRIGGQRITVALEPHADSSPYTFTEALKVPSSSANLRVLVRDAVSGAIGSVSVKL